ncbi:DUF7519 family protein [Halosimplex amylolyticum]|uniref:DUF7519 family protein n=1 Tax=Halosimplex amylolyticum TaxID=3396616 RepID=UPI003F57C6C1
MSAPSETVSANLRPARLSGALSVAVAFGALVSLGGGSTTAFAVEAVGLALLAVGVTVRRDRSRAAGDALVAVALAVVLGALALVWLDTRDLLVTAQTVPGMVGVLVLALGVIPARGRGSRRLVKVGSGLVLLSVFATAVVLKPPLQPLLVGTVAAVLAWDLGENAIGLGVQLGRRAETSRVELAHGLGSAAIGAGAVVAGKTVAGVGTPGFPLGVFALLLIGLVLLAGALHE